MAQHFRFQWVKEEKGQSLVSSRVPGRSDAHWAPT